MVGARSAKRPAQLEVARSRNNQFNGQIGMSQEDHCEPNQSSLGIAVIGCDQGDAAWAKTASTTRPVLIDGFNGLNGGLKSRAANHVVPGEISTMTLSPDSIRRTAWRHLRALISAADHKWQPWGTESEDDPH